jgi:hypothetical protein
MHVFPTTQLQIKRKLFINIWLWIIELHCHCSKFECSWNHLIQRIFLCILEHVLGQSFKSLLCTAETGMQNILHEAGRTCRLK